MAKYTDHVSNKKTAQNQPIIGKDMVKMRSGGYGFKVGDWEQLRRFLILGTIGGTFYASEREMTQECAEVIHRCLDVDARKTIDMIVDVSTNGLALKNDHALFALALASGSISISARTYALNQLNVVARTATHLFMFIDYAQHFRGWGRALKNAVAAWYTTKPVDKLAYQLVKYRNRNGWTHRDVLRKAHPEATNDQQNQLFKWVTQGVVPDLMPEVLRGYLNIQNASNAKQAANMVYDFRLPREAVPTEYLNDPLVWEAMLKAGMPVTALVRNLGVMTSNGTLQVFNDNVKMVTDVLRDENVIQRSRIHPIQVLFALKTYAKGAGFRGNKEWTPIQQIVDALDDAYYLSFDNLLTTDKNIVIGIDISGSMGGGWNKQDHIMFPYEFAAAMAMTTIKTANNVHVTGFDHQLHHLPLTAKMRLDQVMKIVGESGGGRTNAALPIQWAANQGMPVDAFVIYSDGESWAGDQHVSQAIETYRRVMNKSATKLVCVNFTATAYSVADSDDVLSLNIVGNSPDVAQAVTSFVED